MAATLKLCLMVHIEDETTWDGVSNTSWAYKLGGLAKELAASGRGAKVSLQVGAQYFKGHNDSGLAPTSLSLILENGGNFWPHTHCATYDFLSSVTTSVHSAYESERGASTGGGPIGRSGGWDVGGEDFVTITYKAGLKAMNSAVMLTHALVPVTARPYGFDDTDLPKVYPHDAAPGNFKTSVETLRTRPFWMEVASDWFKNTNTIYPVDITTTSAILMIPVAGRSTLPGTADWRTASDIQSLTPADLKAAMTEIWTTFMLMTVNQRSITNVWYKHLPPAYINDSTILTIGAWVDSVNQMLTVNGAAPYATWKNMNEITSLHVNATSRYY